MFNCRKPPKDVLAEYIKRGAFLKGLIQTASLNSPIEKVLIFCIHVIYFSVIYVI